MKKSKKKMYAFRLSEETDIYLDRIYHDVYGFSSRTQIIEYAIKMLYEIKDAAGEIQEKTKKVWVPEGQIKIDV